MHSNQNKFQTFFLKYGLWACVFALWLVIGLYAYLGVYSRYMADDYCERVRVTSSSPVTAAIDRYSDGAWRAANRYSNIMFVGFSEYLGGNSIQITIVMMIVLWAAGATWTVHEARKLLDIQWSPAVDLFLGGMLVYFSFLAAPNLFQTIYWRSSMMTHFAPIVFGTLLLGFLLGRARQSQTTPIPFLVYLAAAFFMFIVAGFSEPPTTTLVTALPLWKLAVWLWDKKPNKHRRVQLIASAFAGVLIGFFVMVLSPAITVVASEKTNSVLWVILTSFQYALVFLLDSVKVIPLPFLVAFIAPFLFFWLWKQSAQEDGMTIQTRSLPMWMFAAPIALWLLIAAGFAPSVFGQAYPVERMRFLARLLTIVIIMLEGAWLGLYLPAFKSNRNLAEWVGLVVLIIVAGVYPLRTASNLVLISLPEYNLRAKYWDAREAFIFERSEAGETDLVIPGLSGVYGVKELDDRPDFWLNRCAAQIYGVNSIRTISYDPQSLEELLDD